MTSLRVVKPGFMSVQDAGRFGSQRYGLSPAGAMDRYSLASVNALLGLPSLSAALEIGPLPVRLSAVGGSLRLAVTGAPRKISIDNSEVDMCTTFLLCDGAEISLGPARGGMFSYLGAEGGINASPQLGSLSVDARASFGSPYPRPLIEGDLVCFAPASPQCRERYLPPEPKSSAPIRVVIGPQDDYFTTGTIDRFLATRWTISPASNRMSYQLDGEPLPHAKGYNIVSDGIVTGHIQVAGSGQPLVLLADRGTTGGYPKIATIITADLGRFAQIPIGESVCFTAISVGEAQREARKLHSATQALPGKVREQQGVRMDSEFLLRINLAGDAVDALCSATDADDCGSI